MEDTIYKEEEELTFSSRLDKISESITSQEKIRKYTIKYPIIMINIRGQFVCLDTDSKDEPTMGIFGGKRTGKTLYLQSLLDQVVGIAKIRCGCINDEHNQSVVWSHPNKVKHMNKIVRACGFQPRGLPVVQVFPQTADIEKEVKDTGPPTKVRANLKWQRFLENSDEFIELGGAYPRFRKLVPELYKCKNMEQVMEKIDDTEWASKKQQEAIESKIDYMDIEEFFDISKNDAFSEGKVYYKQKYRGTYNVFSSLMLMNKVPVLVTKNLLNKKDSYYLAWMNTLIRDIFEHQSNDNSIFRIAGLKVWIFIDEMNTISDKSKVKIKEFVKLTREGGPNAIGMIFVAQTPSKIDQEIINNTKYALVLQMNSNKEINNLLNRFDAPDSYIDVIKNLDKKRFEGVALTTEEFIIIDPKDNKIFRTREPQRGIFIPPLSHPKAPGTTLPTVNKLTLNHVKKDVKLDVREEYEVEFMNRNIKKRFYTLGVYAKVGNRPYAECNDEMDYINAVYGDKKIKNIYIDYQELLGLGYMIVSIPFKKSEYRQFGSFFKGQKVIHELMLRENSIPPNVQKHDKKPIEVTDIIYDPIKRRLRLYGSTCGPNGRSRWKETTRDDK